MLPIETVLDLLMSRASLYGPKQWGVLVSSDNYMTSDSVGDLKLKVRTYLETLAENANAAETK